MSWAIDQQRRLGVERKVLADKFPGLQWFNQTDSARTFLQGPMRTNSGRVYIISITVPAAFPAACPDLIVTSPAPLLDRKGAQMPDVSAEMHTLGRIGDCTKICHYQPTLWTPQNTLYLVAIKGRIWLEAYEAHLRTGLPLDRFLRHMTSARNATAPLPPENTEEGVFVRLLRRLVG